MRAAAWFLNDCPFSVLGLGGSEVKASACNAEDLGSIPGSGRSPGEGNGNPLQYSCLENPMDGGAWWVTVHGVTKSWTRLSNFTFTFSVLTGVKGQAALWGTFCKDTNLIYEGTTLMT